jgi:predicted N-formylglutamate amidohydrolase
MSEEWGISMGGSSALLSQDDPPPATVLNAGGGAPFVIVCDHAGRLVPRALGRLGAPPEAFERHIGLDIGAGGVATRLSEALDACAVLQSYSRLVIDCNRAPEHPEAIAVEADGTAIPGNAGLSPDEVRARIEAIFEPYHRAIAAALDARGRGTVLVAVHSFTPRLGGSERRWGYGVLHAGDSPFSTAMLALLRGEADLPVGDNAPYAMDGTDYTAPLHAGGRGLDYLELEIRQDLIDSAEGQERVAALLARLLPLAYRRVA